MNDSELRELVKIEVQQEALNTWCVKHETQDDARFEKLNEKLDKLQIVIWKGVGVVGAFIFLIQYAPNLFGG